MRPEPDHWDEMKIGPGALPVWTDHGWLSIYHGVFRTMDGVGVSPWESPLHDLQNPGQDLGVGLPGDPSNRKTPARLAGYVSQTLYLPCGAIAEPDGTVKDIFGAVWRTP